MMKRDTEGSLQHVVSFVLRAGVIVSGGVGAVAVVLNLATHSSDKVSFAHYAGAKAEDTHVGPILVQALHGSPRGLMMMAILLLLLTPITRVGVSLLGFIKEKDRVYVVVTTAVLLTLLGSLLLGGSTE